jgi:diguanylate cyclase
VARNRGLRVVAEGVEDQRTWDVLRDLECDVAQGYYLARPLAAASLTPWLAERQKPVVVARALETTING